MAVWRPKYHYAPAANWLSDPNGLVWYDGLWHLYYQYNPHSDQWGHMSWGHAVSDDLLDWRELPVAIEENARHMIYSGSAVIGPDQTIIAAYTGAGRGQPESQAQFLVESTDGGMTFAPPGQAAIDEHAPDFRDPKLFWHAPTSHWIMVSVRADSSYAVIYHSPDLERWSELSRIGPFELPGTVWECPDLMEIPVEGGGSRWLFKVDLLHVDPAHSGSGAIALSGEFDGRQFTPDCAVSGELTWQWVDQGRDFYAAVGWNGGPPGDQNRYWIGWMGNHRYQKQLPATDWRGAMSMARSLSFRRCKSGWRLIQRPVAPDWRQLAWTNSAPIILPHAKPLEIAAAMPRTLHIRAQFKYGRSALLIASGQSRLRVIFDVAAGRLEVDRSDTGVLPEDKDYCRMMSCAWTMTGCAVDIWLDDHSIEIFADDGTAVMTAQTFLAPGLVDLAVTGCGDAARIDALAVHFLELGEQDHADRCHG